VALQYRFQKPFMLIAGLQYARIPKLGDDEPFYSLTTEYDEAANTVTQQFRPLELALSLGGAWTPAPQFTLESKLEALPFGRLDFIIISANFEHIPFEISLLASLKF
jgi:hypothetical protein